MNVKEAIEELGKIKNKNMAIFFDCPDCGKGMTMHSLGEVVLVKTRKDE